eukprot:TRINITY_DN2599_c0_g1_i2.p1 TRINITY_DN2599_c0_g1~~TRINITY_DN2599_c0_g1_i2.p1  ORF type:complete len:279 (-),score=86.77 TRINITY_DN2599_c0_g1_i2:53-889(-)
MEALRTQLVKHGLLTVSCAGLYFDQFDLLNAACGKLVVAKALSLAIILGSLIVKVPQILNILRQGAKGLSDLSITLEIIGYVITIAHAIQSGFSLDAYAEAFSILLQNVIIFLLMLRESTSPFIVAEFVILGSIGGETVRRILAFFASNGSMLILETSLMEFIRGLSIFIFSGSRVPQIWSNFKNKSTGALSLPTLVMQFAGALARIFTTLADVKNSSPSVLWSFIVAASLSGTLILQILIYWNNTNESNEKPKTTSSSSTKTSASTTNAGAPKRKAE